MSLFRSSHASIVSLSDHSSVPERPCPAATLRLEKTTRETLWLQSTRIAIPLLSVLVLRDTTGCHVGSRWLMAIQIYLYLCHRVELPAHEHCAACRLGDTASQPSALGGLNCSGLGLKQQPTMTEHRAAAQYYVVGIRPSTCLEIGLQRKRTVVSARVGSGPV